MNIEEMIWNGASEEDIAAALRAIYKEKERQEEALRAESHKRHLEELKREARIHLVNALIAYGEAFELLNPSEMDQEDIDALEKAIIDAEKEIPKYIRLFDMMGMDFGDLFKEE